MKRIVFLVLAVALAACDSQLSTEPVISTDQKQVSVITVTSSDLVSLNAYVTLGNRPIDTNEFLLGQGTYTESFQSRPIILDRGETANLIVALNGTSGLESDGIVKPVYRFLTDWQPVNPSAHRGIKFDGTSEVYFRVNGFKLTSDTTGVALPYIYSMKTASTAKLPSYVPLELPAEKSAYRFVHTVQLYKIGCSGNDSLTFRSEKGLGQSYNDIRGEYSDLGIRVQEVVLHCTIYSDASAARVALRKIGLVPQG